MQNISSYIWNFSGRIGAQILYLGFNIILARFLSPYDFGIIGILTIILAVSEVLMDAGLGGSLIKEKEVKADDCSTIFVFNLFVSIILYLIIFVVANTIESYFKIKNLSTIIRFICIVFFFNAFRLVPYSLLIRSLKFKQISMIRCLAVFISGITAIVLAIFNVGVYSLVAYFLIQASIQTVLYLYITKYRISFIFKFKNLKMLFSFGFFTTCANVIDTIYENLISILYGKFLSVSSAGFLSQAKKLEEASTQSFTMSINSVAFPILVRLNNDMELFIHEAHLILKNIIMITFPIFLTVALFSKSIILLLYGEEWIQSSYYLHILMFAGCFMIMEVVTRNYIKSLEAVRPLLYITIIKRLIGVCLIFLTLFFSVDYILYAYVAGAAIGYLFNMIYFMKLTSNRQCNILLYSFKYMVPSIIYYIIGYSICRQFDNFYIQFMMVIVVLFLYYLELLPFYNIRILNHMKKLL